MSDQWIDWWMDGLDGKDGFLDVSTSRILCFYTVVSAIVSDKSHVRIVYVAWYPPVVSE